VTPRVLEGLLLDCTTPDSTRRGARLTDRAAGTGPTRQTAGVSLSAETICDRVRRVPPGYVTTYGDLSPGAPRHAGRVLSQTHRDVPWWRVVRADGSWAKGDEQRARLLEEDVPIRGGRVVMREARIAPEAIF
jgi:methylated-DNA-protein-cysteine methyltransferase-like protein